MADCDEECQQISLDGSGDQNETCGNRRAISSGEPSSDGSIDEERSALSDSDLADALRIRTIATQAKGPSSDALEADCRAEQSSCFTSNDYETAEESDNNEWKDVVGSGQLMFKVLKSSSKGKPLNGQEVTIRVVDKTFGIDSVDEKTFVLGYSMVIDAWELVVSAMHEGEIVLVKSASRFSYGGIGDLERNIPGDQDMEYEIELLRISDGVTYSNMSPDVLHETISRLKERGKYYYSRKEIEKAIFVYKRCTDVVEIPRDDRDLRNLFSVIHSNLALCYAKLGDWKATLTAAAEALKLNEKNSKALFRQANAFANMNMVNEAIESLKTAAAMEPSDVLIAKELQRMKLLQRKHIKKERNLYKRMLAGMHLDDASAQRFVVRYRYLMSIFVVLGVAVLFHFFNSSISSYFYSVIQKM